MAVFYLVIFLLVILPDFYIWFVCLRGAACGWWVMLHWVPLAFFVALLILYFSGGSQPFVFKGMIASILCITVPKLLFCIVSLLGLGAGLVQCAGGCSDTVRGSLTAGFDIAGMALAGCFLVAAVYGLTAGPRHLVLREENLVFDDLPASFDGYRIVHLSDLHASSYSAPGMVECLVSEVNALEADLVVFTGDLVNSSPEELDAGMMKALSGIRARDGVFSVVGNHDYCEYHDYADAGGAARAFSEVVRRERAMGWTVLLDSSAVITRTAVTPLRDTRELDLPESPASVERVDSIYIVGVEHCGKPPFGSRGNLQKALSGVPSVIYPKEQSSVSPFKILLSHDPSHWRMDVLPHSDIQLTLSGHTHAMQFRIGRFSPSRWMYPEWYGLYETDARPADASGIAIRRVSSGPHDRATLAGGQQQRTGRGNAPRFLNVSAGLGGSFPFRLGAWPEIVVLTLHCPVSR